MRDCVACRPAQQCETIVELQITERGVIVAERIIEGIAINPANQPPERVEHLRRSDEEMELWRKHQGNPLFSGVI